MFDRVGGARLKQGGFTLIELLIVIVILGILAAVVVFSVKGIQDRGKKSACQSDYATVTRAVEASYATTGSYPTDLAALVTQKLLRAPAPSSVTVGAGGAVTYSTACIALGLP